MAEDARETLMPTTNPFSTDPGATSEMRDLGMSCKLHAFPSYLPRAFTARPWERFPVRSTCCNAGKRSDGGALFPEG